MATFQITGPDGKKYRVQGENPAGAMNALKKMLGQSSGPEGHNNVPAFVPPGVEGYDPTTGEVAEPVGRMRSFLHGAADTTTFGFGDEIASGLGSLLTDRPRQEVLSEMRDLQEQAQEQNPMTFLAGQVGGGVAQGIAGRGVTVAPSLLGRVAQGVGMGGAAGAVYGAGSGTDTGSRLWGAARDGLIGAGMGAAFPLVAAGAGKAYQTARNAVSAAPVSRQAGASPEALRMLGDVMSADGSLGPRGASNMTRAGSEAMLADAGPNARAVLDTAIQRGGPGGLAAREAIDQRVSRGARDVVRALDNTLGTPQGVGASQRAIRDAARPGVNAAYQRAYSLPIDYASPAGMEVENIFRRMPPSMTQRAIQQANELMRWERLPSQIMADIADDGTVTFREMPNVVQADFVKKALDQIVQDGTDELTGKLSSQARLASDVARNLRNAVGEAVPAYREALETAADPLSRQSAIRLGSRLLSPSMTRDQIEEAVKNMTKPERQALAQGVRSQIDDAMARVTRTVQDGDTGAREAIKALKDISSRANREKLALAIGEGPADNLFREMDRIATAFDLRASVADNSKTFARLATSERVSDVAGKGGAWSAAKQGEPLNATKRIVRALTGETDAALKGREDAVYSELARLLTRRGGAGQDVYNAISQLGRTDAATRMMRDRIVRALAGPHLSYPATVLTSNNMPQTAR